MRQVSIVGPNRFVLEEVAAPGPATGQLIIAPLRVGICATDLELLDGSMVYLQNGMATRPLTPGHEWVGRVVEVGAEVAGFGPGDIVVGECSVGCDRCATCAAGDYHRCPDRSETGFMGIPGAMSELMAYPARSAHRIPEGVSLDDAVFVEPIAVAYRAIQRLDPRPGAAVLVVGAGTLGYLAAALLKAAFDADVAIAASRPESRRRALDLGVREPGTDEEFSYVLEAAGTVGALEHSYRALAAGGRLVILGLTGEPTVPTPIDDLVVKDQEIVGSLGSPGVWPAVIELLASGAIAPSLLITRTYPLAEFGAALAHLAERDPSTGKILIVPN